MVDVIGGLISWVTSLCQNDVIEALKDISDNCDDWFTFKQIAQIMRDKFGYEGASLEYSLYNDLLKLSTFRILEVKTGQSKGFYRKNVFLFRYKKRGAC